jgi:hypothetical protein
LAAFGAAVQRHATQYGCRLRLLRSVRPPPTLPAHLELYASATVQLAMGVVYAADGRVAGVESTIVPLSSFPAEGLMVHLAGTPMYGDCKAAWGGERVTTETTRALALETYVEAPSGAPATPSVHVPGVGERALWEEGAGASGRRLLPVGVSPRDAAAAPTAGIRPAPSPSWGAPPWGASQWRPRVVEAVEPSAASALAPPALAPPPPPLMPTPSPSTALAETLASLPGRARHWLGRVVAQEDGISFVLASAAHRAMFPVRARAAATFVGGDGPAS